MLVPRPGCLRQPTGECRGHRGQKFRSAFSGPPISQKLTTIYISTTNFSSVMSRGPEEFKRFGRNQSFGLQIRHSRIEHLLRVLSRKQFSCREYFMNTVIFPVGWNFVVIRAPQKTGHGSTQHSSRAERNIVILTNL